MRLIVTSQRDPAGRNLYRALMKTPGFREEGEFEGRSVGKRGDIWLIATEKDQTLASHLDDHFDPDYYVFATRHRSQRGGRTLTVHVPGNPTPRAEVGGRPRELAHCNADAMKTALLSLKAFQEAEGLDYSVSLEATHHGPTELEKPVLFVEVGSGEEEWNDPRAVSAVARAALRAAEERAGFPKAVGIGGKHYAPLHTQFVLESPIAIGHILPQYALPDLDEEVLRQAIERTRAAFLFLDWKGMRGEDREKVKRLAASVGIEVKRGRDVLREYGMSRLSGTESVSFK
jgi:D-aminoacyl-tRNA deacylase